MADRVPHTQVEVRIDIPGYTSEVVIVNVQDPFGNDIADDLIATGNGRGRYAVDLIHQVPGVHTSEWFDDDGFGNPADLIDRLSYTVGPKMTHARSRWELREDVARRVGAVYRGRVGIGSTIDALADPDLIGTDGDYVGWWVVFPPGSANAEHPFRVRDFNGSAISFGEQLWSAPAVGERYLLIDIDPREIDEAIDVAVQDHAGLARVRQTVDGVPVTDGVVVVPELASHLVAVYDGDDQIPQESIEMLPGRRALVDTTSDSVTLLVMSEVIPPVWDDSLVDIQPAPVIARAANLLHAARAAGSTVDLDEHIRRQLAAQDEWETARRIASGRVPAGAKRVID